MPLDLASGPANRSAAAADSVPLEYVLHPSRSQKMEVLGRISDDWEMLGHLTQASVGIKARHGHYRPLHRCARLALLVVFLCAAG